MWSALCSLGDRAHSRTLKCEVPVGLSQSERGVPGTAANALEIQHVQLRTQLDRNTFAAPFQVHLALFLKVAAFAAQERPRGIRHSAALSTKACLWLILARERAQPSVQRCMRSQYCCICVNLTRIFVSRWDRVVRTCDGIPLRALRALRTYQVRCRHGHVAMGSGSEWG